MSDKTKNRPAVCDLGEPRGATGRSGIHRGQLAALAAALLVTVVEGLDRVLGRRNPPPGQARRFKAPRRVSGRTPGRVHTVRELLEASPMQPRRVPGGSPVHPRPGIEKPNGRSFTSEEGGLSHE